MATTYSTRADRIRFATIWEDWVGESGTDITEAEIEEFSEAVLKPLAFNRQLLTHSFTDIYDWAVGNRDSPSDSDLAEFGLTLEAMVAKIMRETGPGLSADTVRHDALVEGALAVIAAVRTNDAGQADPDEAVDESWRQGMQNAARIILELGVVPLDNEEGASIRLEHAALTDFAFGG